jgi:hypothetical protein
MELEFPRNETLYSIVGVDEAFYLGRMSSGWGTKGFGGEGSY